MPGEEGDEEAARERGGSRGAADFRGPAGPRHSGDTRPVADRPDPTDLRARVAGRDWYHTLELAPGVVTPGWFDTRRVAGRLPWPDLSGLRCLDVGTFDGFWAFEMERRGAREVHALDILDDSRWDWPAPNHAESRRRIAERKGAGEGFEIARESLDSEVVRHDASVYELDPGRFGTFDLVYLGSLLLHLRDPVGALMAIRSVCDRWLIALDSISLALSLCPVPLTNLEGWSRPYWHKPNLAALRRMVEAAGFRVLEGPRPVLMPAGPGLGSPPARSLLSRRRAAREVARMARWGDPHAYVLCEAAA